MQSSHCLWPKELELRGTWSEVRLSPKEQSLLKAKHSLFIKLSSTVVICLCVHLILTQICSFSFLLLNAFNCHLSKYITSNSLLLYHGNVCVYIYEAYCFKHFWEYSLMALSAFMLLYNHDHLESPGHFYPPRSLCSLSIKPSFLYLLVLAAAHQISLYIWLFLISHICLVEDHSSLEHWA